jgi:hypothetical protein
MRTRPIRTEQDKIERQSSTTPCIRTTSYYRDMSALSRDRYLLTSIATSTRRRASTRPAFVSVARCVAGHPAKTISSLVRAAMSGIRSNTGVCSACLDQWTETQRFSCSSW